MNKTRRARGITKFVLLTTPAIALVLFGIFKTISITTGVTACYRQPAAKAQPQVARIDQLLPVPDANKSIILKNIVTVISRNATGISRNNDGNRGSIKGATYTRVTICVEVPDGLPPKDVDTILRVIARGEFEMNGEMSVRVFAFHPYPATRPRNDGPSVASRLPRTAFADLLFAPHGEWDRTDRIYDLDEYKTVITHPSNAIDSTSIEIIYTPVGGAPSGK